MVVTWRARVTPIRTFHSCLWHAPSSIVILPRPNSISQNDRRDGRPLTEPDKLLYSPSLQLFATIPSQRSTTATLSLSTSYIMAKHVCALFINFDHIHCTTSSLTVLHHSMTHPLSASASPSSSAPYQNGPTMLSSPSSASSSARPSSSSSPSQVAKSPTHTCRLPLSSTLALQSDLT